MPVITIYVTKKNELEQPSKKKLSEIAGSLTEHLESSEKFKVSKGSVSVYFPSDDLRGELQGLRGPFYVNFILTHPFLDSISDEVVIFVTLLEKPERTEEVLQELASVVVSSIQEYFPETFIECFINLIPRSRYASTQ